jgi:hypothetical protein
MVFEKGRVREMRVSGVENVLLDGHFGRGHCVSRDGSRVVVELVL